MAAWIRCCACSCQSIARSGFLKELGRLIRSLLGDATYVAGRHGDGVSERGSLLYLGV